MSIPPCTTCNHPTPHERMGPVRDNMGFQHADACELCDCVNNPLFVAAATEPCPTCGTTHSPVLSCGDAATVLAAMERFR